MATVESAWPFNGQSNSEADWSKLIGALAETGIVSGLGLSAGSGMQVLGAPGSAIVRGFYYELTGDPKALAISAAHATLTRRDYIILKLDLAANTTTMLVKAGTPNGTTGDLPALTQNSTVWEHPIGIITVPGGASNIVSGNVAMLAAGIGLRVIPYPTGQRPTPATTAIGVDTTARILELFYGGSWYSLTPSTAWADITGKPATFAPSAHSHAQSDITGLATALAGKAAAVHDHDDRYYQESEIDSKVATLNASIAGKANTSHSHSASDITSGTFDKARIPTINGTDLGPGNWNMGVATLTTYNVNCRSLNASDGVASTGVYNNLITATRRAMWIQDNGAFGQTASSRRFKQNIRDAELDELDGVDPEAVLALVPKLYQYRAQVKLAKRGEIHHAAVELGLIAEEAHEAGLWHIVTYDEEGKPFGIHYDLIGVIALIALRYERRRNDARTAELAAELAELRADLAELRQLAKTGEK